MWQGLAVKLWSGDWVLLDFQLQFLLFTWEVGSFFFLRFQNLTLFFRLFYFFLFYLGILNTPKSWMLSFSNLSYSRISIMSIHICHGVVLQICSLLCCSSSILFRWSFVVTRWIALATSIHSVKSFPIWRPRKYLLFPGSCQSLSQKPISEHVQQFLTKIVRLLSTWYVLEWLFSHALCQEISSGLVFSVIAWH